ncbi:MAG TPA: hypothetical protein VFG47_04795, partial [Geminicoccaceae bacterium]|nr:hypothetical protein [Geminicoccaceae bacterium]
MRRRALLTAFLVLLLVPAGLVLALPWLAEPGLRLALRHAGLGEAVAFDDLDLGTGAVELVGLRLGDGRDLALERLRVEYGLAGLARGRVREVRLDGLVLRGRLDGSGLHFDALDRLAGGADGRETGATPLFPRPDRVELTSARIELATPLGGLVLPVSGEAHPVGGGRAAVRLAVAGGTLTATAAEGAAVAGVLRADLEVAGEIAVRALPRADAVTAAGTLELAAEDMLLPGVGARVTGGGPIRLALDGGRLTARLDAFGLEATDPGADLTALAELMPPPLALTLGTAAAPLELAIDGLGSPDAALTLRGPAVLASAGPRLTAEVGAALILGADGEPLRLEPSTLSLSATDLSWQRLALPRAELMVEARGTPGDLRAALDLDLSAEGEPVPGLRLDGARLRLPADARLDGSLLTLRPRPGARLGAAAFRWRDSVRGDAIELPLDADAGPLLEASLRGDRLAHGRYRFALLPAPFAIRVLQADGAPLELRGTTPRLDLDLHDWATGRLLLADARVEIPVYRLEIAEAGAEVQLAGGGLAAGSAVPVRAGSVRHTGDPAWFRPLSLRGVLRPEG